MTETVALWFLIFFLFAFEILQQRKIKIKATNKRVKFVIAGIASVFLVALFWGSDIQLNLRLLALAVLFFGVGVFNQGLATDKVVTFGSIGNSSLYKRYEYVVIEEMAANKTMVTFGAKKSGSYSLSFDVSEKTIKKFLKRYLPGKVRLMSGEDYDRQQAEKMRQSKSLQKEQIAAIRHRKSRNKFHLTTKKPLS